MNGETRIGNRRPAQVTQLAVVIAWLAVAGCDEDPAQAPVDPCVEQPCSVEAVVAQLERAYTNRDYAHFARLLHDDFSFDLHPEPDPDPYVPAPPRHWRKTDELRIHQRMFAPTSIPAEDAPVPQRLWLEAVSMNLTRSQPWTERDEYYRPVGPLDPTRWKAWGAEYNTNVLFDTQSESDYQVVGAALFVVVQDLSMPANAPGAFRLYRWQDLGGAGNQIAGVEPATWTRVKRVYAPPVDPCIGQPCTVEAV